jgi:uncharacterized damage-inducible protein DinB
MSTQTVIRSLVEYHVASNRRLWDHILAHLSEEQFTQETGFSHGSIRSQVVHLAATDRYWLYDIQSKPVTGLDPADFPDRESFTEPWMEIERELLEYVVSLSKVELEEVPDGLMEARWQALVHVVNHGTDHRAQILSMLHGLGVPTLEQDFPGHLRAIRRVSAADALRLVHYWYGRLEQALGVFPPNRAGEPIYGDLTLHQVLALLAWYDREMAAVLEWVRRPEVGEARVASPEMWALPSQERDQRIAAGEGPEPWEQALEELRNAHGSLLRGLEGLDDELLNQPAGFEGLPEGKKLWEILEANTWFRYLQYTEALWAFLEKGGGR